MNYIDYRKEFCYPENVIASIGIKEIDVNNITFDQVQGVEYCIRSLKDKEQFIIEQFFKCGKSYGEIALTMQIGTEKLTEIMTCAFKKLKKPLRRRIITNGISSLDKVAKEEIDKRYKEIEEQKKKELIEKEKESMRRVGDILAVLNKLEKYKNDIESILGIELTSVIDKVELAKDSVNLTIQYLYYSGEISTHLFNSLARKYGVNKKLVEFSAITKDEIADIKGFGTARVRELERVMQKYGIEMLISKEDTEGGYA